MRLDAAGVEGAGSRPKPMRSKISSGEFREDMSANSSMSRWSRRRWSEVSTKGSASVMKPGLEPVLWREEPPRGAGRLNALARRPGRGWRDVELAPRRHDVGPGLQQPAQDVDVRPVAPCRGRSPAARARISLDVPRGHGRPWAPRRRAPRRRAPPWPRSRRKRRPARGRDARSRPAASAARCSPWPTGPPDRGPTVVAERPCRILPDSCVSSPAPPSA